ncbi:MAG: hypothetical protein LBH88_01825 [Candidatus Methanoplasma sp.]|jgi:hypothetical protein|nr:hypothetical protein [Candidatus Methanoplasma sp.]
MADKSRPILVAIIGLLTIIGSIVIIIAGLGLAFTEIVADLDFGIVGDIVDILGFGLIAVGIISLIIGIGIWSGWTIMWYIAVILYVLAVIASIISLIMMVVDGEVSIGASFIISLIISILILYYLFRPKVKEFFGV